MRFRFGFDPARILKPLLTALLLGVIARTGAEEIRPDLDYFPSRLHAAVFRNWDIVPRERLAQVLGTNVAAIRRMGSDLGLDFIPPPATNELRRNIELVLRRNWSVMPRPQIEKLLGFSTAELDDFLGKEIFLRALLAAPPPGLTPLIYEEPTPEVKARVGPFGRLVGNRIATNNNVPRLDFIQELSEPHFYGEAVRDAKPRRGEADLRTFRRLELPTTAGLLLTNAAADFKKYCGYIQGASRFELSTYAGAAQKAIRLQLTTPAKASEAYVLTINEHSINVSAASELGLARALVELERRMGERGGPFLAPTRETNSPSFSPRYVSSYFSLLTDPLGNDLDYGFPDGYLNTLFHQDAEGIWLYVLLQDLVPSPVFGELSKGSAARLQRLRELVQRAARRGLKVYLYLNEPRAQFLSFFEKYPDIKGQPEGNTAALCTSTEMVQKHLRGSCETLFREVPGLGGVFVITASENLSNCYSHSHRKKPACPRCSQRASADVIAETIRCMSEGVWAAAPEAKFIVWDWSWHSVLGEEVPEQIIQRLPKGVGLMADFERGTRIERGGVPMNVEEYSISTIGPSPRAMARSRQAKTNGLDFLAKIQLSTTWECGTVPFIPVPHLLSLKARAMRSIGVGGTMATWTIGSYPSPNTEAFAVQNWNPALSMDGVLRRVAMRRYGPDATDATVRGWKKLGVAFYEEFPFSTSPYAGPLQHGPSLPLYIRDIPPPFGNATLFNCKDDWSHWTAPYRPELMVQLLHHLCDRWDEGLKDLRDGMAKMPLGGSAANARYYRAQADYGVAWMVGYYWRAYANDLEFYMARDAKDVEKMKHIAAAELKSTQEAFRLVCLDSRLGWEAELQYFYRPLDVLERLISLDAVIQSN
jgi:hypothetical protein